MTSILKLLKERYALAIEGTGDGLWDWNLKQNTIFYSKQWKRMLGYSDPDRIGTSPAEWFKRLHPDDLEHFQYDVNLYLRKKNTHFKAEYRIRHEQGHFLWMLCRGRAVWDSKGNPIRFIGFQTDITMKKKREEQLLHDAFHDPLTHLFNRALFMDRLNQAAHGRMTFAVLYMDMDQFKEINDILGHRTGDELLVLVAKRLETCSRAGDTLARFGGDEFILLLNNIITPKEAINIAARIIKEMSLSFLIERKRIRANITIGIVFIDPKTFISSEDIIRNADIALYQAKKQKRGGYKVFDKQMSRLATSRLKLENDLNSDLQKGKILFYYQPIINLKTNKIVGIEALLRWEHEQEGILKSTDFLSLAEENQLLVKLENTVLKLALKQLEPLQEYFKENKLFVSFNISQQHLEKYNFALHLKKIFEESSINPSLIHIEVPEIFLMKTSKNRINEILNSIKDVGFQLGLDGFGIHYSSLSSLHFYPFDFVKIERSLISEIEKDTKIALLVKNIIQIAFSLGINVIAEGIENESTLRLISDLGCPYGQGFYFSKPLPIEEILTILEHTQLP